MCLQRCAWGITCGVQVAIYIHIYIHIHIHIYLHILHIHIHIYTHIHIYIYTCIDVLAMVRVGEHMWSAAGFIVWVWGNWYKCIWIFINMYVAFSYGCGATSINVNEYEWTCMWLQRMSVGPLVYIQMIMYEYVWICMWLHRMGVGQLV